MKTKRILELTEKDFLTIANLERSIYFALNSSKGKQYQYKIIHAAFKRTCDILLKRRKYIAKELSLKLQLLQDPN
ncbi:MAG: hypothetical protein QF362_01035 [Candidatus Woesearchaeota archaeon]|jgi:hypothetical protein|nr:hypothetical protein [Candidatus Woesearchaeota archaeon]MDP7610665.1 hypothetical protein [Candidatus Woesearchaeota archaeon]|tara:strand:- start:671 stop:895 length:225 start_codon:yes stop_codon:yes gene_type:complete